MKTFKKALTENTELQEQAADNTKKNIKPKKCKHCEGTGFIPLGEGIKGIQKCPVCDGTGTLLPGSEK